MHCKTSNRTQHTGGHPPLAASQAAHGHHRPPVTGADAARAAPFAAHWPYRTFLELGALAGAVPSARLHARLVLLEPTTPVGSMFRTLGFRRLAARTCVLWPGPFQGEPGLPADRTQPLPARRG